MAPEEIGHLHRIPPAHAPDQGLTATTYQNSPTTAWDYGTLVTTEIRPNEINYGGPLGSETILGSLLAEPSPVFEGAYYPVQEHNLTLVRIPVRFFDVERCVNYE